MTTLYRTNENGERVEFTAAEYAEFQEMEGRRLGYVRESMRERRNALLAETDWWATGDRTMTQAETDYRQALRDVPDQAGFPENITWPTKP
jgi:hypothetical protein